MKKSRLKLLAFLFILFGWVNAWGEEHPRYQINARFNEEQSSILADQTVTFINQSSQSTKQVYFHIYPNKLFTAEEKNLFSRYAGYFKINPFPFPFI